MLSGHMHGTTLALVMVLPSLITSDSRNYHRGNRNIAMEGSYANFHNEGIKKNITLEGRKKNITMEGHNQNITRNGSNENITLDGSNKNITMESNNRNITHNISADITQQERILLQVIYVKKHACPIVHLQSTYLACPF